MKQHLETIKKYLEKHRESVGYALKVMDGIELFEKRVFMRQRESRNSDRDRSNDSRGDRYYYLNCL